MDLHATACKRDATIMVLHPANLNLIQATFFVQKMLRPVSANLMGGHLVISMTRCVGTFLEVSVLVNASLIAYGIHLVVCMWAGKNQTSASLAGINSLTTLRNVHLFT